MKKLGGATELETVWLKSEMPDKTVWKLVAHPSIQLTLRLNGVLRKWQLYANDGQIEIFDFGVFGLRSEHVAREKAAFFMKTFSAEQYLRT